MSHENNGACQKCQEIIDLYPDFHEDLRSWFEEFQAAHPEAHVSCAGRGRIDQEAKFHAKASRAHYGESAHNYNCALDLFAEIPGESTIYPVAWFHNILSPNLPDWIEWGANWHSFPEMPHIEIKTWEKLRDEKLISLVE